MKQTILWAMVLLFALFFTSALGDTVLITASKRVNVRELPDKGSKQVGLAQPQESYPLISIAENGWIQIELSDGVKGYISGKMGKIFSEKKKEHDIVTETKSTTSEPKEIIIPIYVNGKTEEIENLSAEEVVTIKEFEYTEKNGQYTYALIAHNNLSDMAIFHPEFQINMRDEKGDLIRTSTLDLAWAYPNQDIVIAGGHGTSSQSPNNFDIEFITPITNKRIKTVANLEHEQFIPFEVLSSRINLDKYHSDIVAELYNPNDYNIKTIYLEIIFRDENGKLIGGEWSFLNNVSAHGKIPFSLSLINDLISESYEIYTYLGDI